MKKEVEAMRAQNYRLEMLQFKPNGRVPNSRYPVLIHRGGVTAPPGVELPDVMEETFRRHDWLNNWRELGVYDYYHFHSTTHEVLGMAPGQRALRLGREGFGAVSSVIDRLGRPRRASPCGRVDVFPSLGGYRTR